MSHQLPSSPIILDCTFRDGGYYNNWDYDFAAVQRYLDAIAQTGIEYVELGFRMPAKQQGFLGALAYTTEDYLEQLNIPKSLKLGVMVNSSDLIQNPKSPEEAINQMFRDQKNSRLTFVRLAAHFHQVGPTLKYASELKKKGYLVGLNIMQSSFFSSEELAHASETISKSNSVDILYFADSMGNMKTADVKRVFEALKSAWVNKPMGIHTHNNMGDALKNTLTAYELGATWLDSTVMGMGRGAGNVATEDLLIELAGQKLIPHTDYQNFRGLFELITDYFQPLKNEYNWGPSFLYRLAAIHEVHPTYIQQMTSDDRYSAYDVVKVIEELEGDEARFYSLDLLQSKLYSDKQSSSDWSSKSLKASNTALVVASGPTVKKYSNAISHFIKKTNPLVVATNYNDYLDSALIDTFCACHPTRLFADRDNYIKSKRPVVAPINSFSTKEIAHFSAVKASPYGLKLETGTLSSNEFRCVLPYPSVFLYTLSLIASTGKKRILVCGLDGYTDDDSKNAQMRKEIGIFKKFNPDIELISLTPTIYDIECDSIFSPRFY